LGQPFKPGYPVKPGICVMKVWELNKKNDGFT